MLHIYILIGKSATGKDTIYKRLLAEPDLHLVRRVPYTTRPRRQGEKEGEEYHFVSLAQFQAMQEEGHVIEYRVYHTCYGLWYYFTTDGCMEGESLSRDILMIGTLESYLSIKSFYQHGFSGRMAGNGEPVPDIVKVVPIYIEVDDATRRQRAFARESAQTKPGFDEMERRFLADAVDFSEERITGAGIVRRFVNNDLLQCTSEIADFIRDMQRRDR